MGGMWSNVMSMCVCMFNCIEHDMAELQIFVHVCGRGSVFLWWRCDTLCPTSGFVDDVMISYNTANGQNLAWHYVQRKFARWRHQLDVRQNYSVWSTSWECVGTARAKCVIYDCPVTVGRGVAVAWSADAGDERVVAAYTPRGHVLTVVDVARTRPVAVVAPRMSAIFRRSIRVDHNQQSRQQRHHCNSHPQHCRFTTTTFTRRNSL